MIVEKHYITILKQMLSLTNDQIWIASQNYKIPNTTGLFVVVSVDEDPTILSNTSYFEPNILFDSGFLTSTGELIGQALIVNQEPVIQFLVDSPSNVTQTAYRADVQVDLISRDNTARDSRVKALGAFSSLFSQQIQELNQFRIFPISCSFMNTTSLEGGSDLNRFTIIIPAVYMENYTASFDYYDTFSKNTIYNA